MNQGGCILILAIILLQFCIRIQAAQIQFTKCAQPSDCVDNCKQTGSIYKLGSCFDGLCGCYDTNGNGVPPLESKNCTDVTQQSTNTCKIECDKSATSYVTIDKSFLCADKCYCQFNSKINRCKPKKDCQPHQAKCTSQKQSQKQKCVEDNKKEVENRRCQTGSATCNVFKGACVCTGASGQVGVLASTPTCMPEKYCQGICSAAPKPTDGIGQICTRTVLGTTYSNCFCPTQG